MIHPSEDDNFDRLLRQVLRATPEAPRIANLADRAIFQAKALAGCSEREYVHRLRQHARASQLLAACTAAAVVVFLLFAARQLFYNSVFGEAGAEYATTSVIDAVAVADSLDVFQWLQSEQGTMMTIFMVLATSVILVVDMIIGATRLNLSS
jgi:hypothetical protein